MEILRRYGIYDGYIKSSWWIAGTVGSALSLYLLERESMMFLGFIWGFVIGILIGFMIII